MKYKDPVQVLRDAITSATGAQTVRVIQEGSLPDTWPEALADEVVDALSVRPVVGASGWVDEASVPSRLGVRAAYGVVEVVGLSVEVTQRPTD